MLLVHQLYWRSLHQPFSACALHLCQSQSLRCHGGKQSWLGLFAVLQQSQSLCC
jgi:hypothetical protein